MATIPVEKKSGFPIWALLLGLLLLGLLIWFFATRDDDDTTTTVTTETVAPLPTATGMDLTDVWVTRVVDANTFYVSSDSAAANGALETLVHIDGAAPTPAPAVGQHVSLAGTLETLGTQDVTQWGVAPDMAAAMTPDTEYVRATGLTLLSGAMMDDGMMPADTVGTSASAVTPATPPATAPSTGTITTTDALYGADLKPIIGRRVELDDATVLSVVGDSTFFVGSGGKRFLVALSSLGESQTGPGDGSDGVFKIEAGQRISLRGTVSAFNGAGSAFRGLTASDRTESTTRGAFVNVTRASDLVKK